MVCPTCNTSAYFIVCIKRLAHLHTAGSIAKIILVMNVDIGRKCPLSFFLGNSLQTKLRQWQRHLGLSSLAFHLPLQKIHFCSFPLFIASYTRSQLCFLPRLFLQPTPMCLNPPSLLSLPNAQFPFFLFLQPHLVVPDIFLHFVVLLGTTFPINVVKRL